METQKPVSVLYILESSPESANSLAFINSYIDSLIEILSEEISLTLFYPEFSDTEEHYSLNITYAPRFKKMVTYIPTRHESFKETYSNERMEGVLNFILKEESFDCVHIWSLKNHSFNYPFIVRERSIPVVITICDSFLFSNSIFLNRGSRDELIRISNFVNSSVTLFVKKLFNVFNETKSRSYWFENIGRYSKYYNRTNANPPIDDFIEERKSLLDEVINLTDRVFLFSELEYNIFYRSTVPEIKVSFLEQGVLKDSGYANKPFEIEGAVKYGFMGEILPEEGILELIGAFNILYKDGYQNELHVFGELHENNHYFTRLKKRVKNPNIFFHGPIKPERLNSALSTIDVLIIPSKWTRSDSFLFNTAISLRKAIITTDRSTISEKVKKIGRGIVLENVSSSTIADAVSELERNRKKLYYFMRTTDDVNFSGIEKDALTLLETYSSYGRKNENLQNMLLNRKFLKKRNYRQRG